MMGFKVLYYGVAPWVSSAYGKNTRMYFDNWTDWFEMDGLFHHGLQGGPLTLKMNGKDCQFSSVQEPMFHNGVSVKYWLQRTESSVVFQHFDTWLLEPGWIEKWELPVITYAPIDSIPIPGRLIASTSGAQVNVAMSKFAQEQYLTAGIEAPYIPHNYDETIYFPQDKEECRKGAGFPDWAKFIVGIVSTNFGPRKNIPNQLKAFKMFLEMTPQAKKDACLFLHTYLAKDYRNPDGSNLFETLEQLDMANNVTMIDQDHVIVGVTEDIMARNYNSMDVLLQCTFGEGFGLPTIEAQACGVPVIGSRNSATTEVIGDGGVTLECPCEVLWSRYNSWQSIPRTEDIAYTLRMLYLDRDLLKAYSEASLENAKQYTTKAVMPQWKEFFETL